MIRKIFTITSALLVSGLVAQVPGACDSVSVECCNFYLTTNQLSVQVSNNSSYLFPYPGFILFNKDGDTIAKETVNYYGIGIYPQEHVLEYPEPPDLPFEGFLELFVDFYAAKACTFPIQIDDTVSTLVTGIPEEYVLLYPNPAGSSVQVRLPESAVPFIRRLELINTNGKVIYSQIVTISRTEINLNSPGDAGLYLVLFYDNNSRVRAERKLIVR